MRILMGELGQHIATLAREALGGNYTHIYHNDCLYRVTLDYKEATVSEGLRAWIKASPPGLHSVEVKS